MKYQTNMTRCEYCWIDVPTLTRVRPGGILPRFIWESAAKTHRNNRIDVVDIDTNQIDTLTPCQLSFPPACVASVVA